MYFGGALNGVSCKDEQILRRMFFLIIFYEFYKHNISKYGGNIEKCILQKDDNTRSEEHVGR